MKRVIQLLCVLPMLLGFAACDSPAASNMGDLGMKMDDMATADLVMDMTSTAKLDNLPNCLSVVVSAATLWADVAAQHCANAQYCHNKNNDAVGWGATDGPSLIAALVGQKAPQTNNTMNFVTAGNPDQSYVLYKLLDQQGKVADDFLKGARMPFGRPPLSNDNFCKFLNWVKGGAK